jgi:hypothetical protein
VKDEHKVSLSEKPTEEAVDVESKDNKGEAANEAGEKEAEEDKVFSVVLLLCCYIPYGCISNCIRCRLNVI